jgi:hypothetical protein
MNATLPSTMPLRPPQGAVLITRVDGAPERYLLSLFPARPGLEAPSARIAWHLARTFATSGSEVWFTPDGSTFWLAPHESSREHAHPPDQF